MVLCIAIRLLTHRSLLEPTYQFKRRENLFFAGQMTGVEGYVESAASGLIAGMNAGRLAKGQALFGFAGRNDFRQYGTIYYDS